MGHGKPAQRHALAVSPHLLDPVWSHGRTSMLFIDPTNGSRSINSKREHESIEAAMTQRPRRYVETRHVRTNARFLMERDRRAIAMVA
jgi:hypothetical protein